MASSAPDDESPARPSDAVEVARIIGAWGIKGGIRLKPYAANPQALFSSKRWFVEPGQRQAGLPPRVGPKPTGPLPRLLRVVQAREHGDGVVATCHEVSDRDAAEALAGARIFISRASFPTPDDNEFYWVDLIGLSVRNRGGLLLGVVTNLIETGPHCVLCIQPEEADADEVLVPFVDAYVDTVDRDARVITVDWDPGY
jgi:16S rRNA processing protein RimM